MSNAFCCCFSYHALPKLHYTEKWYKLVAAKRRAQEEGISVWEAECHLDSNLFLDEYPWWRAYGPQYPCILQRMFVHAEVVGQKECERSICWDCWPLVPRANTEGEAPAIQRVGFRTIREEIWVIYNEVYQMKRLLGPPPYGLKKMEALDREVCNSLEEQMWQRWGSARLQKEPEGGTTGILQPSCQSKSPWRTQVRGKDPHVHALAEAREVHWRPPTSWSRI